MKTNIKTIRRIETIRNRVIVAIFVSSFLWFWVGIFTQFLFLELLTAILAGIIEYLLISAIDNELEKISKEIQNKKVVK